MKFLRRIAVCLFFTAAVFVLSAGEQVAVNAQSGGGNMYVSQSGTGDGSSCNSARSVSWFNNAANWASVQSATDGKIGPGDTVHLCGTLTSPLTIQGSGTAGNVITILFESGAKLSSAVWSDGSSAISGTSKSYLLIDGGLNGIIEATNIGTARSSKNLVFGVWFIDSSNIEVKKLIIRDLYVRTPGSTDRTDAGYGVVFHGSITNVFIHDNVISQMKTGISTSPEKNSQNINIYGNTITSVSDSIDIITGSPVSTSNIRIYNNRMDEWLTWSGGVPHFHHDGIQIAGAAVGARMSNIQVYGNSCGPTLGAALGTPGTQTACIFLEQNIDNYLIYNNVLYSDGVNHASNGFITFRGPNGGNGKIFNNVMNGANQGGIGIYFSEFSAGIERPLVQNNVFINLATPIYESSGNSYVGTSDNNAFYNISSSGFRVRWRSIPFSSQVGTFIAGETVIGQTSGATAKFWRKDGLNLDVRGPVGTFSAGEVIRGQSSGATVITTGAGTEGGGQGVSVSSWQSTTGHDAHSITNNPNLDSNHRPGASSPIVNVGVNLSQYFTTDKNGVPRPQGPAWDIGAYEYGGGGWTPTPTNGACGSASGRSYPATAIGFGSDTFCSAGTASPTNPSFPAAGTSVSWSCLGSNGGSNASCSASRAPRASGGGEVDEGAGDGEGSSGTSPPSISITTPTHNQNYPNAPATITMTVSASDADGISRIDFYDGNTYYGKDDAAPYSYQYGGLTAGAHTLRAVAFDNQYSWTPVAVRITVGEGTASGVPAAPDCIAPSSAIDLKNVASPCPVLSIPNRPVASGASVVVSLFPRLGQYVYKTVYVSTTKKKWKPFTLSCGTDNWCTRAEGSVHTLTLSVGDITSLGGAGVHYVAAWDYTWNGACWLWPGAAACGEPGFWRVHKFEAQ